MFIALWLFFVILNGKLNLEIALTGIVVAAAGMFFACVLLGWDFRREWTRVKKLPNIIAYGFTLLWEIFKANIDVLKRIYSRRSPEPDIVNIPRKFKPEWQTSLLANSITLTPGTITMSVSDESLTVHCLDASLADGLKDSSFEKGISKLGEKQNDTAI